MPLAISLNQGFVFYFLQFFQAQGTFSPAEIMGLICICFNRESVFHMVKDFTTKDKL